jgi:hypothetical protein
MKLTLELNGQETMPEIQRMKALFDAFVKDADDFVAKQKEIVTDENPE